MFRFWLELSERAVDVQLWQKHSFQFVFVTLSAATQTPYGLVHTITEFSADWNSVLNVRK